MRSSRIVPAQAALMVGRMSEAAARNGVGMGRRFIVSETRWASSWLRFGLAAA